MDKINLSIYLIKSNITKFEDIIENESTSILHKYDDNSIAYYSISNVVEPKWLKKFFNFSNENLKTANARVLYLKRIQVDTETSRIFAISFGYGKTLLKEAVFEEQFGLKIVLNTIDRDKIRKISKTDIGKNYKQSQEQMPRESDINGFGFDINRDLIKYVTGKSEDDMFGKGIISGGDIFNLSIEKNVSNIDEFLLYCYKKYQLTSYKKNFEWLDNIKLVRETWLIDNLNNEVVKILNSRDFTKIWLALPEIINWEKVKCVYISNQKDRDAEYNDIDNDVFMESFTDSKIEDFDQIKSKTICLKSNEDNSDIVRWSAAKCLVGSITLNGQVYAINSGSWYKIDNNFELEINHQYNKIPLSKINFVNCPNNDDEDKYNELLVKSIPNSHLIHKYKIPIGGGSGNNIEPCDVAVGKTLIHVKKNGGSSYLSHFFNQAVNSCTALKDTTFRTKFKEKLNSNNINDIIDKDFEASNYTVVLGIINNRLDERPHIPFFSKVSIKYAYQNITNLGYKFEIKNIYKEKSR